MYGGEESAGPGNDKPPAIRRRGTLGIVSTATMFVFWQLLMIPRLITDAKVADPQTLSGIFPIEAIAVLTAGLIGHGIHLAIWIVGSLIFAGLLVLAQSHRIRRG